MIMMYPLFHSCQVMGLFVEDNSSHLQMLARLNGIERANETIAYGIKEYGFGGVWTFAIIAIIAATVENVKAACSAGERDDHQARLAAGPNAIGLLRATPPRLL